MPKPPAFDVETLVARLARRDRRARGTDRADPRRARALLDAASPADASPADAAPDGPRPVLFAAPVGGTGGTGGTGDTKPGDLDDLASLSLALGAGWALEPMAEAFVATARWVRPTILVAPPLALDALANAWDESDARWSRLEVVVVRADDDASPGGAPAKEAEKQVLEGWAEVFGCPARIWSRA